jgi:hypothetical protein
VKTIPKTTLEYWALIAEIAGAIAVVMSVIYLGVQVRANTKVLRSQAHFNLLSLAQRPFEMVIDNEGVSKILNVGFATPEKLSPEEWIRCSYYMFMQFNAWEYLYYQNRDGGDATALDGGRNLMRHRAGLYHFVIAVWIAKRQKPPLQQKVHR